MNPPNFSVPLPPWIEGLAPVFTPSWRVPGDRDATDEIPLIGREPELRALDSVASRTRVCTLVGAGGLGKTRLAREWAVRRHAQGEVTLWCDLEWVRDRRLARQRLDRCLSPCPPAAGWLVLDAVEGVLDEVARWLPRVLPGWPGLRVLVTSRAPLRMPQEVALQLQPLALPPLGVHGAESAHHGAVRLLDALLPPGVDQDAEHQVQNADGPARDWPGMVSLCRGLDGWPLALELAAGHLVSTGTGPAHLAMHLGAVRRHRGATILASSISEAQRPPWWVAWFLNTLDADERRALRGCQMGGGGPRATSSEGPMPDAAHCGGGPELPMVISRLRGRALLRTAVNGSSRRWMPRLIEEAGFDRKLFPQ